jgi:hypothetical protein
MCQDNGDGIEAIGEVVGEDGEANQNTESCPTLETDGYG